MYPVWCWSHWRWAHMGLTWWAIKWAGAVTVTGSDEDRRVVFLVCVFLISYLKLSLSLFFLRGLTLVANISQNLMMQPLTNDTAVTLILLLFSASVVTVFPEKNWLREVCFLIETARLVHLSCCLAHMCIVLCASWRKISPCLQKQWFYNEHVVLVWLNFLWKNAAVAPLM